MYQRPLSLEGKEKKFYQYKNLYEDNTLLCSVRFDAMN